MWGVFSRRHETSCHIWSGCGTDLAAGDPTFRRIALRSRLHAVLLVAQGTTCPEAAALVGDAPRSVEYWVHRFQAKGLAGLREGGPPGRPRCLDEKQREAIHRGLRGKPSDVGMRVNLWDGKTLSAWIEKGYGILLGVRQC
jgi:transposase